jgi:hypothetical protein
MSAGVYAFVCEYKTNDEVVKTLGWYLHACMYIYHIKELVQLLHVCMHARMHLHVREHIRRSEFARTYKNSHMHIKT